MKQLLVLLFLAPILVLAQNEFRHTVYFDVDQHGITSEEISRLEKFLDPFMGRLPDYDVVSIELKGHTDSDASANYNMALSKRRVDEVSAALRSKGIKLNAETSYYGESDPAQKNDSDSGKQKNRRVEIIVFAEPIAYATVPPPPPPPIKKEELGDSILIYPQGTRVIIDKEYIRKNPNCLLLGEFNTPESIREGAMTTMSEDGTPLVSGGMFDVKLCKDAPCITVQVPVRRACGNVMPFTRWERNEDGSWREINDSPLPVVEVNGQSYYSMEVCRSGILNCDVRSNKKKKRRLKTPVIVFKAKGKMRFDKVMLSIDDPMGLYKPKRLTSKRAIYELGCPCTEPRVQVRAIDKKTGDTLTMSFTEINTLDKREALGRCKKQEKIKKVLFIPIRDKVLFRKYLIRRRDLKKLENN